MPEISRFLGIIIKMFFTDNPPPHLHAVYNEYNGRLNLETLEWLESDLPKKTDYRMDKNTSKRIAKNVAR